MPRTVNDSVLDFLSSLPYGLARDIAEQLRYSKGDTIEWVYLPHEKTIRLHNKTRNRYLEPRPGEFANWSEYASSGCHSNRVFGAVERAYYARDDRADAMTYYTAQQARNAYIAPSELEQMIQQVPEPQKPVPRPPPNKPQEDGPVQPVLVIAGNREEAEGFANEIMGWKSHQWVYIDSFIRIHQYRSSSVYIVGTARERKDFGAIEGLFHMNGHEVLDTNE